MDFDTTIASPSATSYLSVEDADEHISRRDNFDEDSWMALTQEQKEYRLILATMILDSLAYRGGKAVKTQNLAFPRLMPGTPLYVEDASGQPMPFTDLTSLQEYADLMGTSGVLTIPTEIKFAQTELAFQVVHSHLLTLEPMDSGEASITSLGIDVISLSFGAAKKSAYDLFSKEEFGATSIIKMYLRKYLSALRMALV
jgi:hypothetical protein